MPQRESTVAGAPCWLDLMTSDQAASTEFYTRLFGWTVEDRGEDYGNYVIFSLNGSWIAGMMQSTQQGVPDMWNTYLAVDDIKASTDAASAAGAKVIVPPMAVQNQGSMALVMDPSGAAIGLWQEGEHPGYRIWGEPGAPVWHELHARDYEAATGFYRDVFNWDLEVLSNTPEFRYSTLGAGQSSQAGIFDAARDLPNGAPSQWIAYFGVSDTDAAAETVTSLGGTVLREPFDSPYGRMVDVTDSTGARLILSSVRAG